MAELPLLKSSGCHSLLLVHFRGVSCGFERVAGLGQRHEVFAVVFMGLFLLAGFNPPPCSINVRKEDRSIHT